MTNKKQPTQPNDYSVRYNHFSQPFKRPRFVFLTINLVMPCEQQRPKQNNRENPAFKTKYRVANIYLFSKHLPNAVCAWDWKKLGWNSKIVVCPGASVSLEKEGDPGVCVQRRDTAPKHRVLGATALGRQSALGTQWREPATLPAGRSRASERRRSWAWFFKDKQRFTGGERHEEDAEPGGLGRENRLWKGTQISSSRHGQGWGEVTDLVNTQR